MPIAEQTKYYAPVGRCIYCGAKSPETTLGDEHIIPYALGGRLVLPKASCNNCSKITGAIIERQVLRHMFGALRIARNYPTRKKKERPTTLPAFIEADGELEYWDSPVETRPAFTAMFAFPNPGVLSDLSPEESRTLPMGDAWISGEIPTQHREALLSKNPKAKGYWVGADFNAEIFARMLAKIGHAYLVAKLGIDGFSPLLNKAIIGQEAWYTHHFVGGIPTEVPASEYSSELAYRLRQSRMGRPYYVVRIRFFGDRQAPVYLVVGGEPLFSSTAFAHRR